MLFYPTFTTTYQLISAMELGGEPGHELDLLQAMHGLVDITSDKEYIYTDIPEDAILGHARAVCDSPEFPATGIGVGALKDVHSHKHFLFVIWINRSALGARIDDMLQAIRSIKSTISKS